EFQCVTQNTLSDISKVVADALEPHWPLLDITAVSPDEEWLRAGAIFLASRIVDFLSHVFQHLQNLTVFIISALLLMLLAWTSYLFQPRSMILLFNWSVILSIVAVLLFIFIQMDRNELLSVLSGTIPGRLSWNRDLVFRLLIYSLLPILVLLGAQYP